MYEKYYWINNDVRTFMSRGYLENGQSVEDRVREIGETAEKYLGIKGYAEVFIDIVARGWVSLASPIWSNFGAGRGLSISCNGSYVGDSVEAILAKNAEVGMMSKLGAGTSGYFGDLRPRGAPISSGGKSEGVVSFLELYETTANVISQNNTRRGSFAAYLPVEHKDILEFLDIRETGHRIQNMSIGVTLTDAWMQSMVDGDKDKRAIWAKIIKKRFETGYPYIMFSDTVNRGAPQVYKDKNLKIHASNLCSEIALSSGPDESFVCCLSSMNLLHYDEWKSTNAIEIMMYFLDAVMEDYIIKTDNMPFMQHAHNFAVRQRAVGLGVLGWHSYLQSKRIPFESLKAKSLTNEIFKLLNEKSLAASKELATRFGEPALLKGYGERFTTRLAIAPTTSSSFILGQVSPSVEPLKDNYFVKDLAKGKFPYKNPALLEVLESYGKNDQETWESILKHGGSVQHLQFLSDVERAVFKTFGEISQKEIVTQASIRQKYIDQAQSINLMIPLDVSPKEVSNLMIDAWKMGVKTLYYQRGANPAQSLSRTLTNCVSCEA